MTWQEAAETEYDPIERPVQNEQGTWDALDSNGRGHALGYASKELVEAWLDGYGAGVSENL